MLLIFYNVCNRKHRLLVKTSFLNNEIIQVFISTIKSGYTFHTCQTMHSIPSLKLFLCHTPFFLTLKHTHDCMIMLHSFFILLLTFLWWIFHSCLKLASITTIKNRSFSNWSCHNTFLLEFIN